MADYLCPNMDFQTMTLLFKHRGFNATLYAPYGQLMVAQRGADGVFRGAADTTRVAESSAGFFN